jgi:hypothetical protein
MALVPGGISVDQRPADIGSFPVFGDAHVHSVRVGLRVGVWGLSPLVHIPGSVGELVSPFDSGVGNPATGISPRFRVPIRQRGLT